MPYSFKLFSYCSVPVILKIIKTQEKGCLSWFPFIQGVSINTIWGIVPVNATTHTTSIRDLHGLLSGMCNVEKLGPPGTGIDFLPQFQVTFKFLEINFKELC